jgi:hypothetical protein
VNPPFRRALLHAAHLKTGSLFHADSHPICHLCCCYLGRRDQHLREAVRDCAEFLSPAIDLPGVDIGATGNLADRRPWRQALGDNRPFLFFGSAPSPFRAGEHLNSRHGTVSCTGASTVICTDAARRPPTGPSTNRDPEAQRQPNNTVDHSKRQEILKRMPPRAIKPVQF